MFTWASEKHPVIENVWSTRGYKRRWNEVFEDLTCVCLVSFLLSVSFRHTVPTWLCMEFYKLSMKPSWTLCTLFIDALWLWSCWLCSQWLYYLIFFFSLYFSFGFIVSVVLLCCDKPIWCQQCFYLFYFSCNKKKVFHAVSSWTPHFLIFIWEKSKKTAAALCELVWNIKIYLDAAKTFLYACWQNDLQIR